MSLKRKTESGFVDVSNVRRYDGTTWRNCSFVKRWGGSQWVQIWPDYVAVGSATQYHVSGLYGYELIADASPSADRLTGNLRGTCFIEEDNDNDSGAASFTIEDVPVGAAVTFDYTLSSTVSASYMGLSVSGCASGTIARTSSGSFSSTATATTVSIHLRSYMSNYSMSVSNLAINGKPVQFYRYDEKKMSGSYVKKLAVVLDSWDTKNCSLHSIYYSDTKGERFKETGNVSASSDGNNLVTMTFSGPEYWPEGYNMTIKYQYYWEDYDEDSGWNSGTTSMSRTITWADRNTVIAE